MVTLGTLYRELKEAFEKSGLESPRLEAKFLLEGILKTSLTGSHLEKELPPEEEKRLRFLAGLRILGEPLQYLLGEWEFYGYPFYVGEGVLIPRPDTETLASEAISLLSGGKIAIDLCSGSGCVAVAMERETGARVYAVEKYQKAMEYLNQNIRLNHSKVTPILGDVLEEAALELLPMADVITANPPYLTAKDMTSLQKEVSFEPPSALYGGEDGLSFYRKITALWKRKLLPGGSLLFEHGAGQDLAVAQIMEENGFTEIRKIQDLTGTIRVVAGKIFREE